MDTKKLIFIFIIYSGILLLSGCIGGEESRENKISSNSESSINSGTLSNSAQTINKNMLFDENLLRSQGWSLVDPYTSDFYSDLEPIESKLGKVYIVRKLEEGKSAKDGEITGFSLSNYDKEWLGKSLTVNGVTYSNFNCGNNKNTGITLEIDNPKGIEFVVKADRTFTGDKTYRYDGEFIKKFNFKENFEILDTGCMGERKQFLGEGTNQFSVITLHVTFPTYQIGEMTTESTGWLEFGKEYEFQLPGCRMKTWLEHKPPRGELLIHAEADDESKCNSYYSVAAFSFKSKNGYQSSISYWNSNSQSLLSTKYLGEYPNEISFWNLTRKSAPIIK